MTSMENSEKNHDNLEKILKHGPACLFFSENIWIMRKTQNTRGTSSLETVFDMFLCIFSRFICFPRKTNLLGYVLEFSPNCHDFFRIFQNGLPYGTLEKDTF